MNITEIKELLAGTPTAEQLATLAADERKEMCIRDSNYRVWFQKFCWQLLHTRLYFL